MLSNSYAGQRRHPDLRVLPGAVLRPAGLRRARCSGRRPARSDAAFTNFQPYIGVNPEGDVDAIAPDFEPLSTWKYSLGADYDLDLSRIGLGDDWQLRANVVHSDVNKGYDIYEGRRRVVGTAPDGRPIYDIPAGGDYIVRNTGEGGGQVYSLNLAKTFDTDLGLFDTTFGYTYQDLGEVRSYNRFVGFETYAFDPQSDLNNPSEAHTRYETKNRITSTAVVAETALWRQHDGAELRLLRAFGAEVQLRLRQRGHADLRRHLPRRLRQ